MLCPCHNFMLDEIEELKDKLTLHKWVMSERAGRDIGETEAKADFAENHFRKWAEVKRVEYCKDCECYKGKD